MSIEVNGVTLPNIPSDVLAQYPYAFIVATSSYEDSLASTMTSYWLYAFNASLFYVSKSLTGNTYDLLAWNAAINGNAYLAGSAYTGTLNTSEFITDWADSDVTDKSSTGGFYLNLGEDEGTYTVLWSNYDICAAALDSSGNFVETDDVYFARNDVSYDEEYIVKSAFIIAMADKAREVSSTTDKLTTDKIQAAFDTLHSAAGVEFG